MSVNITVNGKYVKSCPKHNLLDDPERVRKETENERRKMRIQQVRQVSKNMAKKVRNNVELEKERQLKKIEEIKAQEMEMWRQKVLAEQQRDFRSAIFEVGTAHRAAQRENAKKVQDSVKEKSRKLLDRSDNVTFLPRQGKENKRKNANFQTDITGKCYPKPSTPAVQKQILKESSTRTIDAKLVRSSESEELSEEETSSCVTSELSSEILLTSTSSLSDSVILSKTKYTTGESDKKDKSMMKHKRMVPVFDIQPESEITFVPNIENKQSNMHSSQTLPKKTPKKNENKKTVGKQELKSTTEEFLKNPKFGTTKKRFTQITDIIRQQKSNNEIENPSTASQLQSETSYMEKSPRKLKPRPLITTPHQSEISRLQKSPTKTQTKSPASSRPVSTQTAESQATKPSSTIQTQRSSATKVQFYDYNNKFQKQYAQSTSGIEIHETDHTQMNAMEQAELAAKLREARELEMEKGRQRSDERCQKAIEREQVRRACEDLTAKLDALTKQRPALPSDNHNFSSIRLGQVAAQKESKLNNAIEEILKRPAIITCPVINREQTTTTSNNIQHPETYNLNLGTAFRTNEISSLNSSDSCCSILLGYVNDQSEQIADDIKKYNKQNGETNKMKAEKLQNLLDRINRLRENLINELEKFSTPPVNKDRVQTLMDSISEFRKERESILVDNNSKDSITKREKDLKKKEAILEKKLREFYELQRAARTRDLKDDPDFQLTNVDTQLADATDLKRRTNKKIVDSPDEESGNVSSEAEMPYNRKGGKEQQKNVERVSKNQEKTENDVKNLVTESEDLQNRSNNIDTFWKSEKEYERPRRESERVNENHVNVKSRSNKNEKTGDKHGFFKDIQKKSTKNNNIKENEQATAKNDRNEDDKEILPTSEEESEEEFVERRKLIVGEKPLEIVIKLKGDTKSKKHKKNPLKSPRRLSSLAQSPTVRKSRKRLSTVRSNDSSSTSYRSLPPTIHNNVDELLINIPKSVKRTAETLTQPQPRKEEKNKLKNKPSNLNPLMAHYVQRLLGMSRASINALEVNSSDVDTPSSSIINRTANLSAAETEKLASNRLEQVQKFIEDNYSFIDEVEGSFRQSNTTDSSLKRIEVIWKKALKEHKSKKKDTEQGTQTETEKHVKKTIKKTIKKQRPSLNKETHQTVDKSTQLTDNCNQRIAELTEMINKVRQEKQKILETTLSSVSENGRNSTEYLDLPDRRNNSVESGSRILDLQLLKSAENLATQSPETAPQLEKDKSTGMSRDSGISLSRPITVQESHDSPTEELRQAQSSTESLSGQFIKPKPPISIARYSPQLVEDIPHELSTIFEVDTPATSRINTSIHANNIQEHGATQLQDEQVEKIAYRKFPTFEEYAQLNQLDLSQFDPEFSMQFQKEFNEFRNLAREGKIVDYEEFTSFSKYFGKSSSGDDREAAEELLASLKLANLSFKKFPTRKEYLDKIGISTTDLLDSQSLDNAEETRNINSNSSSTESLINIEKELKMRKILIKPFQQNAPPGDKSLSSTFTSAALVSPHKLLKKKAQQGDISGIRQLTSGAPSIDEQCDHLENELRRLGINWPSVMKKKTLETQALSSTSSSLEQPLFNSRKKSKQPMKTTFQRETHTTYETTTETEDGGRQLNFREFLTKELLKRTTTSSSFSFSDDSIASSILRSIIGSISPTAQQQVNGAAPGLERHKTSTPMASQSTSSGRAGSRSQGSASSGQLFSGESRLSSVHYNNSSKDVNGISENDADAVSSKKF